MYTHISNGTWGDIRNSEFFCSLLLSLKLKSGYPDPDIRVSGCPGMKSSDIWISESEASDSRNANTLERPFSEGFWRCLR